MSSNPISAELTQALANLELQRSGPADATVGMISLPLPRELAGNAGLAHPHAAMQPLAWWEKDKVARRALAMVAGEGPVPATLQLATGNAAPAKTTDGARWQVAASISREQLDFVAHPFTKISELRGVPGDECTTVEYELRLTYGERDLVLQCGATGPHGTQGPYYWQNVQVDTLWENEVAQAVRVGGVIYNEDTYLWADLYLLLFSNGVAHVAAHFVTTKLHIEGYDFNGLPLLRFAGDTVTALDAAMPAAGTRFTAGALQLNFDDAALLCSDEFPGVLKAEGGDLLWYPVSRIFNPQNAENGEQEWPAGFARTVRFQFALGEAAPVIARYTAPAWWYALCGEPWSGQYMPVRGGYDAIGELTADAIRGTMRRGRFDAPSAPVPPTTEGTDMSNAGNDGDGGVGMLQNFYHTRRPELFRDALDYCYYWADIHVDHRDFTVRQWVGGWGWKTCAYTKFRDVLYGYLETGDPYLKDTAEMVADAYWAWFRSNWPRCTIGRDSYELGALALMWRFLGSAQARDRALEMVRMIRSVLEARGNIGGQMGGGPHPGYLASLYMTGVCMVSLLDVAAAAREMGEPQHIAGLLEMCDELLPYYNREDTELFPSNFGTERSAWNEKTHAIWATMALRIDPEVARLHGEGAEAELASLRLVARNPLPSFEHWTQRGRLGNQLISPFYHGAMLLGARLDNDGIALTPLGDPALWPSHLTVETPYGDLVVEVQDGAALRFAAANLFPVTVHYRGATIVGDSQSSLVLPPAATVAVV